MSTFMQNILANVIKVLLKKKKMEIKTQTEKKPKKNTLFSCRIG